MSMEEDDYKETKTNQPLLLKTNTEGNRVVTCMMGIGGHTHYNFVEKVDTQSKDEGDHVLKTNIGGNRVITSAIGRGLGGHVIHNIVEEKVGEQRSKEAKESEIMMMVSLQSHWGDNVLRFPDHSYQ